MGEFLTAVHGRSLVSIRTHMHDREATAAALCLPTVPLSVDGTDPVALWLAPDQWLLVSEKQNARALVARLEPRLSSLVYLVTDVTAAFRCYSLTHRNALRLLGAGSGMDFESLAIGQCVRTRFANIALIAVLLANGSWELYVDATHAAYFESWIRKAFDDSEMFATG